MVDETNIALANSFLQCSTCFGTGRTFHSRSGAFCKCVLRKVFHSLLNKYELAINSPTVSIAADYAADFWLLAKRTLSGQDWIVFRLYFIGKRTWQHTAAQAKLNRGNFFHHVYRIEEIMADAAMKLKPYALYPFSCYFGTRQGKPEALKVMRAGS